MKKQLSLFTLALCCLFASVAQAENVPEINSSMAVTKPSFIVKPSIIDHTHPLSLDIYDEANDMYNTLQRPEEVLAGFPLDKMQRIDWMGAINNGLISPRGNLTGTETVPTMDKDIIMMETKGMPYVRFPHLSHTKWLGCQNCHNAIFEPKINGSPVNMVDILKGQYCGTCHGRVAFPANEACERCHNEPKPGQKAWWK